MSATRTTQCSVPGCETPARATRPDVENGPTVRDLDDVFCSYHDEELTLIGHLAEDAALAADAAERQFLQRLVRRCPACGGNVHDVEQCPYGADLEVIDDPDPVIAWDRPEDEPCQRGTVGCSIDHENDEACQTW